MTKKEIYIKVTKDGPYLVYGTPKIFSQSILTDTEGVSIKYGNGKTFEINTDPIALCRCGKSNNAPFCDGSHLKTNFEGTETASFEPILEGAKEYEGSNLTLMDNEKFCAYARFCDAHGSIWNLIFNGDKISDAQAIEEAKLCPSGRLMIFDKEGKLLEPTFPQEISILEDDGLKISGPIRVMGKIRVESESSESYEIRNRQTLCRCGYSHNKPFCDGTHASAKFQAKEKKFKTF